MYDFVIFTVGHSNRSWDEFLSILLGHNISKLADIRRFPGSRLWPQFNKEPMEKELAKSNIEYRHIERLGGRRKEKTDGLFSEKKKENDEKIPNNNAWKNKSFGAYADYMATNEFKKGIDELLSFKGDKNKDKENIVIMCAETLPWRCHRRLIGDYLAAVLGIKVYDILDISHKNPHRITPFAQIENRRITYPLK